MLDFDKTDLDFVLYWSRRTMRQFKLGGFLVAESSPGCYHVVFDRWVDWRENMKAVSWAVIHSHHEGLKRWFLLQCRKGSSTLRISCKGSKGSPEIIYGEGKHDHGIDEYLSYRDLMKACIKKLVISAR